MSTGAERRGCTDELAFYDVVITPLVGAGGAPNRALPGETYVAIAFLRLGTDGSDDASGNLEVMFVEGRFFSWRT